MEQEDDTSHHFNVELLKRPIWGLAEEYGPRFPSVSNLAATATEENMILDDIEGTSGSTLSHKSGKWKNKGKNNTKMRAKPQRSEEEHYTTYEDRDFSDFRGQAEGFLSAVAPGGQPKSYLSPDGSSSDSTAGRWGRSLQEDREATPTSLIIACVSDCFLETHARGD